MFLGFCFECGGGSLRRVDGEIVCEKCGRVWGCENVDESVPLPEDDSDGTDSHFEGHWQPGSSLCFLKGLGDPALENNGHGGARRIKVMLQAEDPPQLRRILQDFPNFR